MTDSDHKIEDIKRHLYDPVDTVTHRVHEGVLHKVNHKVESEWRNEELNNAMSDMRKPKTSIFKKFFIVAIIFFFGAALFSLYTFSKGGVSVTSDNIDITVIGNAFTKGGEELPLEIEIVNRNKANLELANLLISYPSGASNAAADVVRLPRINIGTIKPGETVTKNIKVILFGDERSDRNVTISLDYHPAGSNAIFTKEKAYAVNISSAPLSLSIDAPSTVTSDQPISFTVKATLNTTLPSNDTMLQLTYPNNFIFESAIPAPVFNNSMWSLSDLSLTNPVKIIITGRIIGQDQDQQVFHVYAGTTKNADKSTIDVVYNSLLQTITIIKPFLEANILVNDTSSLGEKVNVKITWANNLSDRITDGQIIANLGGNVFDKMSVDPGGGFFDSQNNRIIWDKNSDSDLANIEPGGKGEVNFSIKSLSSLNGDISIKDPQMSIDVSINGREPSLGSTYTEINNSSKKIVKILSDFQIASSASYKDGSLPPKAETLTRYNVTWSIRNGSNALSGAVARSILPIYVKWVSNSSQRENITYNDVTREVIWNIGSVNANTGGANSREGSFIIALNPSTSQIGSVPQLMKEVFLSGTDAFTGTIVKDTYMAINTLLSGDPVFQSGQERVIQ